MSVIKAFFGLGRIPKIKKYFEFESFDDLNQTGGMIGQIQETVRRGGLQLTPAQKKFLEDQMKQVELAFDMTKISLKSPSPEKSGKVIQADFGKPFKEEVKKMETDAQIKARLEEGNKKSASALRIEKLRKEISDIDRKIDARVIQLEQRGVKDFETDNLFNKLNDQKNDLELKKDFEEEIFGPQDMADGGRIGYKLGGFKNLFDFFNKKNPIQAYRDYLKSVKDRMKAGKELEVASEVLPIAGGGMLINRALKKKLESMSEEDVERKKERDDKAYGGRIGFKKGMDRRTFMKMVGGLTALPILGKFFKGAEVAAPVAEKAAEIASGAPPYFFNLVDRIRALGTKFAGPKERSESFRYKDYEMDIDYDTGAIEIKKTKEAMIPGGDEAGISEEVYMTYKPGMADETTKGRKTVDEYEEFTARPDIDGKMKDVEDGVPDEVVREGSISKEELEQEIIDQIAREKKASGGLAYMLGE